MVHLKMFFTRTTEIFQGLVILINKDFTYLALSQDKQIFFQFMCWHLLCIA